MKQIPMKFFKITLSAFIVVFSLFATAQNIDETGSLSPAIDGSNDNVVVYAEVDPLSSTDATLVFGGSTTTRGGYDAFNMLCRFLGSSTGIDVRDGGGYVKDNTVFPTSVVHVWTVVHFSSKTYDTYVQLDGDKGTPTVIRTGAAWRSSSDLNVTSIDKWFMVHNGGSAAKLNAIIAVDQVGDYPSMSFDASLSAITSSVGELSPAFTSDVYSYLLKVPNGTTSIDLTATKADADAIVSGDGQINISAPETIVSIEVTAQAGNKQIYNVYISFEDDLIFNESFDNDPNVLTSGNYKTDDPEPRLKTAAGWTAEYDGNSAGGVFQYGTSAQMNDFTVPATDFDGNSPTDGSAALGVQTSWGSSALYYQPVTLPAGSYKLSYQAYNAHTANTTTQSLVGWVPDSGISSLSSLTSFPVGSWTSDQIEFVLTEETSGRIQIGVKDIVGGSGSNPRLFFDDVKFESLGESALVISANEILIDINSLIGEFSLSGVNLTEDITLTAPAGIILSGTQVSGSGPYTISSSDAMAGGVAVSVTAENKDAIAGEIVVKTGTLSETITIKPTSQNLMADWDGAGATGAGSEPNNFGWDCSPSITWAPANEFGVRLQDDVTYSYNGGAQTGRILYVRWDGVGGAGTNAIYSYPATLEACKSYVFKAKVAWNSNGSAPEYAFGISTMKDNSGDFLVQEKMIVPSTGVLHDVELVFTTNSAGTYYFTMGASNAVLGAITDLEMSEYFGDPWLSATTKELKYDSISLSHTFTVSGYKLTSDISITGPEGMTFSPETITPESANCGVEVTAAFSNKEYLTSGKIKIVSGDLSDSIIVTEVLPPYLAKGTEEFSTDGTWCWFQDPRAVYYEGEKKQTYTGWITSDGKVQVGSYNHDTEEIKIHTLVENFQVDDHNNPTFLIREDGRIIVAYSGHFYGPMRVLVSTNPEDITSWGPEANFGDNVTYANPYQIGDSTVMFYRDGVTWHPTINVSMDGGVTWGTPHELIRRDGSQNRPYAKYTQDSKGGMHITFTTGHPRNEPANKIYYVYFKNSRFYKADGTLIKVYDGTNPLYIEAGEPEVVYDASAGKGWTWDIALDENEQPVILYAAFPNDQQHDYYYAHWNGTNWDNNHIVNSGRWFPQTPAGAGEPEPNYSGGMTLDPANTSIVYLSKQVNDVFEIYKYTTPDYGVTWESEAITKNTPEGTINVRPVVARGNKSGTVELFWMRGWYITYANYHTSVMYYSQQGTVKVSSDASLKDLTVDGMTLADFSANTISYDVELPVGATEIPSVEAVATDDNASVVINKAATLPGATVIVVTAEDGTTTRTYTINFTVAKSTDATLQDLIIDGVTISGFSANTLSYDVELPVGTTEVPNVEAVTTDTNANLVINDATALPGATIVLVTAEDGTTTRTYTINFTVAKSTDATLQDLTFDGVTVEGFSASTLIYEVELPFGTTTIPSVSAVSMDANANVVVTDAETLPGDAIIVVTAEDGVTTQTYTISFSVAEQTLRLESSHFSIYPNPVTSTMTIEDHSGNMIGATLIMYDLLGNVVFESTLLNDTSEIDISDLKNGVYLVVGSNNSSRFEQVIIKK